MAGHPAHHGSVLIIDLTLDQAMAESAVIFRGRDCGSELSRRIEAGLAEIKSGEDLTLAELVQRLSGQPFQCLAEQDKADVTIFGARTGCGSERDAKSLAKQFVLIMGGLEELDIGGQAGGMGQKHAERYLAASVCLFQAAVGETGQKLGQWLIELELAAIVQNHAGGGGRNNLADRC